MSKDGNAKRWRSKPWRQFPTKDEGPPPAYRLYEQYEGRSGVIPFAKLAKAFQSAVIYPPKRQLGTNPNAQISPHSEGRSANWIPEFEYKLLHSLCARSRAVYNLYILQKKSARAIADHYGWGFISQSEVYFLAGRVRKLIDAHYDNRTDYDWDLAWMLAEEGASDEEIIEIIKCKPQTFRKKQLSIGRSRSKLKRLPEESVRRIKRKLSLGYTCSDLAAEFSVWPSTIRAIKDGRWHKDVTP